MIKKIKYFVSDVDGVLTDGKIFYKDKCMYRFFNIKDGVAFKLLKISGIHPVLISGKESKETYERFKQLGLEYYFEGIENKVEQMEEFIFQNNTSWEEICYIGDDLPDIPPMKKSAYAIAPADAVEDVKLTAHYVCKQKGGDGAFREAVELILKEQNRWTDILEKFFAS